MFVNCSNHPSEKWVAAQREAALVSGEIVDVNFPAVPARSTPEEIEKLAERVVEEIMRYHPERVLCQGEFTLTYKIVSKLKAENVIVVAACSERKVCEEIQEDGITKKFVEFYFEQFREY